MKALAVALAAMVLTAGPALAVDYDQYDALLQRYVAPSSDGINRVRYAAWHANPADLRTLDSFIVELQQEQPSRLPRDQRFAYWVNLYNAATLQVILQNYPVRSIRDIRSRTLDPRGLAGPWRTQVVTVEGRRLSLDDIEHRILRRDFGEPRVHYAVNCASIGCPNLMARAWRAETLEADLEAAARAYVNQVRGVSVDAAGLVRASSIYDWFAEDFGGERGVLAHLRRYASPPLAQRLANARGIARYDYDWSLNEAR